MWDIKYRPVLFSDLVGQDASVKILKARLSAGTAKDTSYIFSGGYGQGKTTTGRILARAILCEDLNKSDPEPCNKCDSCLSHLADQHSAFQELDAASNGTISHVRALVSGLNVMTLDGGSTYVVIYDEVHRMSKDSQDVLLKPLEEKKFVGILCTTEPEEIRGTIRSRCEEHRIRRATREALYARMQKILGLENVSYEQDGIFTLIDFCDGHVRDIINKMESFSQTGALTLEHVRSQLKLSSIPLYYNILLNLDNPPALSDFIDEASELVLPDEIVSGMVEAAMGAFRVANKMSTSYVTVDPVLAQKVYDKFGSSIVGIAKQLSMTRVKSKTALVCEALTLLAKPVVSVAMQASVPASPAPTSPAPIPSAQPLAPAPQEIPAIPPPVTVRGSKLPSLKVTSAELSLTSLDYKFIGEAPRGGNRAYPAINFEQKDCTVSITPEQWTSHFLTLCQKER